MSKPIVVVGVIEPGISRSHHCFAQMTVAAPYHHHTPTLVILADEGQNEEAFYKALTPFLRRGTRSPLVRVVMRHSSEQGDEGLYAKMSDLLLLSDGRTGLGDVVPLTGVLELDCSNRLQRHLHVQCEAPYPHDLSLTIDAIEGQDEDALTEALEPHLQGHVVTVLAALVDGELHATVADIVGTPTPLPHIPDLQGDGGPSTSTTREGVQI